MVHKAAIEHIVRSIPGAVNNHYAKGAARIVIEGRAPDVIVRDSDGRIKEVYEVETIRKNSLKKKKCLKRILVIALADDDWEEIRLLTDNGKQIMERMTLGHQELEDLERRIRIQRGRLKGYNKRIGRRLSEAREKKRVENGWGGLV
jgi:hypothetical protein